MKAKVGPAALILAVVVLAGFCYFMYKATNTSSQGAYDPNKYGPPDYVKNMKKGGNPGYAAPHGQGAAGQ